MLTAAGLPYEAIPSNVDEGRLRRDLESRRGITGGEDIARALAAAKAEEVSRTHPDRLVIGGDQVLALGGVIFEKPPDLVAARRQLLQLRGQTHALISAVVLVEGGRIVWQHADTASLTMRDFSSAFLDRYLATVGADVCLSVGAYQLEGLGAQLFDHIEGDYFTILGMPLIALLGALRARGLIET